MAFKRRAAVAVFVALSSTAVFGQTDRHPVKDLTVDELKRIYLACERASMRGLLSTGEIAQCSVIYEELKQRAFDGDFEKLLAWSKSRLNVPTVQ